MSASKRHAFLWLAYGVVFGTAWLPGREAAATNGLNAIGFGTESEGMAGADVA